MKRALALLQPMAAAVAAVASLTAAAQAQTSADTTCTALEGRTIAASAIKLPTSGATITSATVVAAAPQTGRPDGASVVLATPAYCKVLGAIAPKDPAAGLINFQINLPVTWNGKIMQLGGGGTNGSIPVSLTTNMQYGPESLPPNAPYALTRGFVVYGSNSGHQSVAGVAAKPPEWMRNRETLENFLFAQMKKTHDVAVAVVTLRYRQPVRHSYYFGSSTGGREAMIVAQRFPADYDGVFAQVDVLAYVNSFLIEPWFRQRAQAGDGWIPPAKVAVIAAEIRRQCDSLDGIADGYVSNYVACNALFDGSKARPDLGAIRCSNGADAGDACLSDPQIASVNQIHAPIVFPFPLHKGWTTLPGWSTGSETATNWKILQNRNIGGGPESGNLNYFTGNPASTLLNTDLAQYREQIQAFSAMSDPLDPDLSAFRRRGGKLVMKVNTADYTVNARWSYAYYDKVVALMGQKSVDEFLRLYVGIGLRHARNLGANPLTNAPTPGFVDFIAMIDDWVDGGKAPAFTQVLSDISLTPPFEVRSSLPMCQYPAYPHYEAGDPKQAASYECRKATL